GVVNGGGFLLIRFADVLLLSPGTMAFIAMIGGFTALFGSVVLSISSFDIRKKFLNDTSSRRTPFVRHIGWILYWIQRSVHFYEFKL
ncbi:MAG: hypothetical protein AAF193_07775, partial [Bacteroidota bacterium]